MRERAKNIKWRALETLDQQLEEFEMNFTKRGGKVIWAQNSQEALDAVLEICKEKNCKRIVKSKSMVTEEIHLNKFLEKNNIESVETDLGEYIQQLDGEPPYHIVTPAMHKSKEDVAKVFADKLGTPSKLFTAGSYFGCERKAKRKIHYCRSRNYRSQFYNQRYWRHCYY